MKAYSSSSQAMEALKKQGYTQDFNLHSDWLECIRLDLKLNPEEFHVDEIFRFEGMNDPDSSEVLFAISSTTGVKGLLIDAYGAYSESLSPEMIKRLKVDDETKH